MTVVPPPMPPRGSSAAVRRALEDAAATLIAERGYARTTVDDIVGAAGVSKPALYRHFASKKDLHLALLERHRDELAAAALAGLALDGVDLDAADLDEPADAVSHPAAADPRRVPDLDARVHAMVDAWFAYVEQHPFVWLMFRDTTGDPEVLALHGELQARQRATDVALLRALAPGIPEDELEPLGELIRSSLYGLALHWRDRPDIPRATLVATMTRMLRGLVLTTR